MTDLRSPDETPALDDYVNAFGQEFAAAIADDAAAAPSLARPAQARKLRRRLVRFGGIGVATLAAVAAVVVFLPILPSPGQHDVVSGARAKLGKPGMILHYVISTGIRSGPSESGPCAARQTEIWQTTLGPLRFRTLDSPEDPKCGRSMLADGTFTRGPIESSSEPGRTVTYYPALRKMLVMTGSSGTLTGGLPALDPANQSGAGELITTLRRLFRERRLRELKRGREGGRDVVYLVGKVDKAPGTKSTFHLKYIVDAQTYAPVRLERRMVTRFRGVGYASTSVWRFSKYEQLPVTPANETLLTIRPTGPVKITTKTLDEFRADAERRDAQNEANRKARAKARTK